jgi:biotin synthase
LEKGAPHFVNIERNDLLRLLMSCGKEQEELHARAAALRDQTAGKKVYFRGLIEFSNVCANNCYYCGIRKGNKAVNRYSMTPDEIMACIDFCVNAGYGSIVLQAGELRTSQFADFVESILLAAHKKYPSLRITLSVGEQEPAVYKRWFDAGAARYLLRIETSDETHYATLHPPSMSFANRKSCLYSLKEIGYQTGTGVLIGSPFQTLENLADDLLFFKEFGVDMVGMGPFIPHENTMFADYDNKGNLDTALNMIALLRIMMPDINIAAATALQAIRPDGRELGLMAGANVIMPLVTPKEYRHLYRLYDDKPCMEESAGDCLRCVVERVRSVGLEPGLGEAGDSRHYLGRTGV